MYIFLTYFDYFSGVILNMGESLQTREGSIGTREGGGLPPPPDKSSTAGGPPWTH